VRLGEQAAAAEQPLDEDADVVALGRRRGGGQQLGQRQPQALVVAVAAAEAQQAPGEGDVRLRHRLIPGRCRSPISPSLRWTTSRG